MRVVVVIPAYNEARTLRDIVQRALAVCERVVVVDDGSRDGSASTLPDLPIELRVHDENRGKAAAIWTGFEAALAMDADLIVTLDADGQHRPEDVRRLVGVAAQHPARIVIGARLRRREAAPRSRRIANSIADFWLSWACGHPVADSQSGQRAYPAALIRALVGEGRLRHDHAASFTLESELLIVAARRGIRTIAVPIDCVYAAGSRPSHFRPVRDITRIVRMVARHLVMSGLHPPGLWRVVTRSPQVARVGDTGLAPGAAAAGEQELRPRV
jgi:glycosyltransferase involved in cell wall biosynthesis